MSKEIINIKIIVQNILHSPEILGLTTSYAESDMLRYKQYGRYDAIAVQREGKRLLALLAEIEASCDARLLRKWQKKYLEWQKKLTQLKFKKLVHGEFSEAGRITIYTTALLQECTAHGWDYAAYYASVLVHERLHYLQHECILRRFSADRAEPFSAAYKNAQAYWFGGGAAADCVRTVKEALAEFIRFLWCKEQGQLALAADVWQSARGVRAYYPANPYAGVRYLCVLYEQNPEAALWAWAKLWETSLSSWQKAYSLLIGWDEKASNYNFSINLC